jgi:uncharacterized protein involved in type VI secretion and phage assembly
VDAQTLTSGFLIKVNGTELPGEQANRVSEIAVEQSLHIPDMITIRINDVGDDSTPDRAAFFKILDENSFRVGSEVEIGMGRNSNPTPLIKAEITSVELDVSEGRPPIVIIRGYDRSHRLHRGRHSRSFLNTSDANIVTKIAQEAGLQATVESTPTQDYVFQNNQTNWEFLRDRASRHGFELFVENRTLHFRKPKNGRDQGEELELWNGLLSLRVKVSSSHQVGEVTVKAWDPKSKKEIVGRATSGQLAPKIGLGQTGSQLAAQFGTAKVYVVNRPVDSQAHANALAQAVYDELDGSFVQAEGTLIGNAKVKPGLTVPMNAMGNLLKGSYYITSTVHTISLDQGYRTSFVVSGRQTNSLLEMIQSRSSGNSGQNVVIGIVTNNTDPDNLGRVKVKFPWLADDESWWARIASPMAGKDRGFYFLPEIDDEVLVSFEHGDMSRPFILGALWNGMDKPPKPNSGVVGGSKVNQRIIKTRAGHTITLDDTDGNEKISIVDKTQKNFIQIESKSNQITIEADGDILIKSKANQKVEVQGNASIEAKGNIDMKATGTVSIEGGSLSIKANGTVDIQGKAVNIN